ncbi:MAG: phospho-sugar mutase [Myxococcota bacterium]
MSFIQRARAWIAQDPDPDTREELESLIAAHDEEALEARLSGALEFGTAGLRGIMGAGPNRMNRVNVMRTTYGFCEWLKAAVPESTERGICIAHDARLKSEVFAQDAIEVALGLGFRIYSYSRSVPTPLLAFAVLDKKAAGGVMITASHNPPDYNGYKVFWENGAQIIPPNDVAIAKRIHDSPPVDELPRVRAAVARSRGTLESMDRCARKYVRVVAESTCKTERRRTIQVSYTALHGVAEPLFRFLMSRTGFCKIASVREQARPDGTFPTVPFPNPEEPGAMDRVIALGSEVEAELALANDPDGDRLGVAIRHHGRFEMLSGNEIGILLADDLLRRNEAPGDPLVISTIVSSPMLGHVAKAHGARWEQTLTGHKWIQNRALELADEGYHYVFGYEEALGFAALPAVRDKDGVSAAMLIVDLASRLLAEERTLVDALEDLFRQHGFHGGRQHSRRYDGPTARTEMAQAMHALRTEPPTEIGGRQVLSMTDLERRVCWTPEGTHPMERFDQSDTLLFDLGDDHEVMVRPSGTEPKVKYYLYAKEPVTHDVATARERVDVTLDRIERDLGLR